jgi:hypothetical protein
VGSFASNKKIKSYWKNLDDFNKGANQEFALKNKFQFFDLLSEVYPSDSEIDLRDEKTRHDIVQNTIRILESPAPSLLFNGKKAYQMFLMGLILLGVIDLQLSKLKRCVRDCEYGLQGDYLGSSNTNHRLNGKAIYLAPNTSSMANSFDEFVWIDILNKIK